MFIRQKRHENDYFCKAFSMSIIIFFWLAAHGMFSLLSISLLWLALEVQQRRQKLHSLANSA